MMTTEQILYNYVDVQDLDKRLIPTLDKFCE